MCNDGDKQCILPADATNDICEPSCRKPLRPGVPLIKLPNCASEHAELGSSCFVPVHHLSHPHRSPSWLCPLSDPPPPSPSILHSHLVNPLSPRSFACYIWRSSLLSLVLLFLIFFLSRFCFSFLSFFFFLPFFMLLWFCLPFCFLLSAVRLEGLGVNEEDCQVFNMFRDLFFLFVLFDFVLCTSLSFFVFMLSFLIYCFFSPLSTFFFFFCSCFVFLAIPRFLLRHSLCLFFSIGFFVFLFPNKLSDSRGDICSFRTQNFEDLLTGEN